MKRYLLLLLFVLVLVLPKLMAMLLAGEEEVRVPRGAPRLIIVTPHNQDIRREFRRAFVQWHRDVYGEWVDIEYRTPGGTGDIRRMLDTYYRGWRDGAGNLPPIIPDLEQHIVWGGGDFFFDVELKPLGILQPIELPPQLLLEVFPEPDLAGVKLYDASFDADGLPLPPRWIGICLSSFGIVYNPDVYRRLGLDEPTQWSDLTHPRLAGWLALADPTHSGSAAVAYMMVIQRAMADAEESFLAEIPPEQHAESMQTDAYRAAIAAGWKAGMGQLLLIAANSRYFGDSASQVPNDVGNGDAAAGMAIDFYGRVFQESVGPERCRFVSPRAATAITPDPVGILHGMPEQQRIYATRFVEFLLTPEGQLLWILEAGHPGQPGGPRQRGLRRPPIRHDLYADRTGWTDDVNPFEEAGDFNQRPEWMALFGETRPLWAAAWIDSRDSLRSAHSRVMRISDTAARDRLLAQLADLPVEMNDLVQQRQRGRQVRRIAQLQQELDPDAYATPGELRQRAQQRNDERFAELADLLDQTALDGTRPISPDLWRARQRIDWGRRFREHYARVEQEARRGIPH